MSGYMTSSVVGAHLDALATAHPTFCTRSGPGDWAPGRAGATSGYVKIGATTSNSPSPRWAVLLIGGIHARELAPPDALVSFLEKLAAAYAASSAITYPAWTDPVNNIVYDSFTIPWPWVRRVVEYLDLYVAPCVNPDGRDWVLAPLPSTATKDEKFLHKEWRKNRRPAPSGNTDPKAIGVDLNRNFDALWDFTRCFDVAKANVASSTTPSDWTFSGPSADGAEAEPETKNVAGVMRNKNISFFIDFHAYSRDVLYCWGFDTNQSTDASQTFTNTAWDHKRDGTKNTAYSEYIPATTDAAQQAMAKRISDLVFAKAGGSDPQAQARSRYEVKSSADLYVTSGTSQDYCFARWFTAAIAGSPIRPVTSFTIEVGGDPKKGADHDEGGFTPDYVKHYPKLEREIHVAAWAFLTAVAAMNVEPPSGPPPPSGSGSGSSSCLTTTLFLGATLHPDLVLLRDVRDRQLPVTRLGRLFAAGLVHIYAHVGPGLAERLGPHAAVKRALRVGVFQPFTAALRLVSTRLARRRRARSHALGLLFVLASPAIAAGLALAGLGARLADLRAHSEAGDE
jgi:murein tripeptide amidase MpaA